MSDVCLYDSPNISVTTNPLAFCSKMGPGNVFYTTTLKEQASVLSVKLSCKMIKWVTWGR